MNQKLNAFAAEPILTLSAILGVGLCFAKVPAGYLLWCQCTAQIHTLNDEYTCQWHLPMQIN